MDPAKAPAGIGHNAPSLAAWPEPEALYAAWSREHADLLARRDRLLAAMDRLEAAHGAGIADEATAGKAADFVLLLEREARQVEEVRKSVKAPVLAAGRTLDRLLKAETSDRLTAAASRVARLLTEYQVRKIAAEREVREQAARQAREAADTLAAAALAQPDAALREQALALDQIAQRAEIAATAGLAALARTHSESGAVADLKEDWTYEVVDFAQVPREWLMVDDRKLRAAIRGPEGLRSIPGLRIHPEARTTVR
jgi:hypothetical protein